MVSQLYSPNFILSRQRRKIFVHSFVGAVDLVRYWPAWSTQDRVRRLFVRVRQTSEEPQILDLLKAAQPGLQGATDHGLRGQTVHHTQSGPQSRA